MPIRVQLSRKKGWRMPENTVNVARPSRWGNPFVVGKDGTQAEVVELYRYLLSGYLCVSSRSATPEQQRASHAHVRRYKRGLKGKNLACWCRPGTPCHADVLLEIANS